MRCWPTRPTPAGRTERCCASAASRPVIPERADQQGHRLRRGSNGGRPVSYDTERYKDRNVIERSYEQLKQWRGLATRYDKLAVIFRGGAILRSIIVWLRSPIGDTP
jgi:putative transposase